MSWEQNCRILKTTWTKYSQTSTCRVVRQEPFPKLQPLSVWIHLLVKVPTQIGPLSTISLLQIQRAGRKTTLNSNRLWKWMCTITKWTHNGLKTSQIQSFQIRQCTTPLIHSNSLLLPINNNWHRIHYRKRLQSFWPIILEAQSPCKQE